MDEPPAALVLFPFNSQFIRCFEFCQNFNLNVTECSFLGFDIIVFYDPLELCIFRGWSGDRFLLFAYLIEN